jgi:hypothetical protein
VPPRDSKRQVVRNLRPQPIEIHHGDTVVVVPALGQVEIAIAPAAGGQLDELRRRGLVAVEQKAAASAKPSTARSAGSAARRKKPAAGASGKSKRAASGERGRAAKPDNGGS